MTSHLPGLAQQIAYYEERLRLDQRSRAFLPLADLYRRAGRHDQARRLLERGLAEQPGVVSARAALALVLAELGEAAGAAREAATVIELDPDHLVARRLLARDAVRREDWTAACDHYEHLLRLEPEDADIRRALREARGQAEARPKAEPAPRPADQTPVPPRAPATAAQPADGLRVGTGLETPTLAEVYLRQGHPGKAREILDRILASEPDREDALAVLARLDRAAGDDSADAGDSAEGAFAAPRAREAAEGASQAARPATGGAGASTPGRRTTDRDEDLDRFRAWIDRGGSDASGPS
jgi:predicted Zn-dependent protease